MTDTPDLADVSARLGWALHAAGVPVTPERAGRFAAALDVALPASYEDVYWAARVTLVSDRSQLEVFERVFRQLFGGVWDPAERRGDANAPPPAHTSPGAPRRTQHPRPGSPASSGSPRPDGHDGGGDGGDGAQVVLAAMSAEERLRSEDFAALTPEELAELRALMERLALAPPLRRGRRTVRHPKGRLVDLRATLRRAHRTGGDALRPIRRRRRTRRRRVVFLCDISGSMAPYTRAYLQLLVSAVGGARAEAFVFGTRLTRVTRELHAADADVLARAGRAAPDWAGGTRIGRSVKSFNDEWGRRGLARGAVIVVVSDGWEHDDPAALGREMERLARLAHRVIWVNPRRASPRYQPLVGGMAAALPHCDRFVSGHSLAAVDEVLAAIAEP